MVTVNTTPAASAAATNCIFVKRAENKKSWIANTMKKKQLWPVLL